MQADPDVPPFLYGSHYSSAGAVLFYLIRLEPFSGLARTLQARDVSCNCCNSPALCLTPQHCCTEWSRPGLAATDVEGYQ